MLLGRARRACLAFLAGALGAFGLPPFGFFAVFFVSFPILVWLLDGIAGNPDRSHTLGLRSAFFIGWLFGFGYFTAGLWWIGNALLFEADQFAWALPLAVLGLPAVLALFYGLATMLARLFWSDGLSRIAALAAGFGLVEWLRSFVATGFPWNAIGYGAMPIPLMMQSAAPLGLFGVSTLAVLVFAMPALLGTRKGMVSGFALAGLLIVAHLGYGALKLVEPLPAGGKTLTVRLVQPAIDEARKLENSDRIEIFNHHLALSAQPVEPGKPEPDIIVWPETSIPFILTDYPDALARIADVLKDGQVLVTGAVRAEEQGAGQPPRYYNSIYVIDDKGQIISASDKVHLTPFGEYVPYEGVLRRIGFDNLISLPGGFSPAAQRTLLSLPSGMGFYPLICYEAIFPDEIQIPSQANAIVNLTNDAWFGMTPGPYQHFLQARIRAVEAGLPLIRGANNGISALVDVRGRIISGLSLNAQGVVDATMDIIRVSKWNNSDRKLNFWLVMLVVVLAALISRMGFIFRKN
ncbi:apolipoprotein N-acyltransferase [Sphingomonas psychrolutea]|nr:apolipoprotein N-acyltransferase [Sphingomonas psychrolutea]